MADPTTGMTDTGDGKRSRRDGKDGGWGSPFEDPAVLARTTELLWKGYERYLATLPEADGPQCRDNNLDKVA